MIRQKFTEDVAECTITKLVEDSIGCDFAIAVETVTVYDCIFRGEYSDAATMKCNELIPGSVVLLRLDDIVVCSQYFLVALMKLSVA